MVEVGTISTVNGCQWYDVDAGLLFSAPRKKERILCIVEKLDCPISTKIWMISFRHQKQWTLESLQSKLFREFSARHIVSKGGAN